MLKFYELSWFAWHIWNVLENEKCQQDKFCSNWNSNNNWSKEFHSYEAKHFYHSFQFITNCNQVAKIYTIVKCAQRDRSPKFGSFNVNINVCRKIMMDSLALIKFDVVSYFPVTQSVELWNSLANNIPLIESLKFPASPRKNATQLSNALNTRKTKTECCSCNFTVYNSGGKYGRRSLNQIKSGPKLKFVCQVRIYQKFGSPIRFRIEWTIIIRNFQGFHLVAFQQQTRETFLSLSLIIFPSHLTSSTIFNDDGRPTTIIVQIVNRAFAVPNKLWFHSLCCYSIVSFHCTFIFMSNFAFSRIISAKEKY